MAYRDKIAPKRENPVADPIVDSVSYGESNQERGQGQSSKYRSVSTASKVPVGNQVRVQGNTKGTSTVGKPSAVSLQGKKSVSGASENPDGQRNRAGKLR
jgi:hypothetical protein